MGNGVDARYSFESAGFAGDVLAVLRARWSEGLDRPYVAELHVTIDRPDEDYLLLLGRDAVLTVARPELGLERRLTGIVTQAEQHEVLGESRKSHFLVRVEPALALLELSQRSRIFQDKSAPEIIEQVLGESLGAYGRSIDVDLSGDYPTREYCVQYRESDRAFVERLMQEEGIRYAFDHVGDTEVMLIRDGDAPFEAAPLAGSQVPFVAQGSAEITTDEPIHRARRVYRPVTAKVSLRDHDWTAPASPKEAESGEDGPESYEYGLGRQLVIGGYGGNAYTEDNGAPQAERRLQGAQRDAILLEGSGRVIGLAPGAKFTLSGSSDAIDGEYVVVEIEHTSSAFEGGMDPYSNRFRCIPSETPYRPARTREKPRVPSVQTAVVTGPAGEEIHTDVHGRIKVQFPWDREGAGDDKTTCFIRVQQPWAGAGWGFTFIPRIGMEVVVHFDHGDPDRPLVHGCVYNSEHALPYALPAEKTKSTIKSNSSPGGGGFNEWRFEDKAGEEQIYLHAQKDLDEVVLADHTTSVGGDQTNTVGNNQTQQIDVDQFEKVDGTQTMTVDGNRKVEVGGTFLEIISSGEKRTVAQAEDELVLSGETRLVIGTNDEHFSATEDRIVLGGQKETVVGVLQHDITGAHSDTVSGALSQFGRSSISIESTGSSVAVSAGATVDISASGAGLTVTGSEIVVDCAMRTQVDPFWYAESSGAWSTYGGVNATIAAVSIGISGLSQSATIASLALTGGAQTYAGPAASFTGLKLRTGSAIYDYKTKSVKAWLGFRIFMN